MRIEIGQIITQIISFLIMYWVMKRYAWKPLLNLLDARRDKIKTDFDTIDTQKKEIENIGEEYRQKLKEIDSFAFSKTQEAIEKGKQIASDIQKEAHVQAKEIVAKAHGDLQKEIAKSKEQLKDEVVKMAMQATEKILESKLDKEKKKNLLSDFIEEMRG